MNLNRHDLVWIKPTAWSALTEQTQHWKNQNWPCVVRRNEGGHSRSLVAVGIPLPQKIRVGLVVSILDIQRHRSPLWLREVLDAAPVAWRPLVHSLEQHAEGLGLQIQVYGSLAYQALTGENYLTPASDIDVLFRPKTFEQMNAGLQLLLEHSDRLPLDGEIEFPNGVAVAWKEWLSHNRSLQAQVLGKSLDQVKLWPRRDLVQTFEHGLQLRVL